MKTFFQLREEANLDEKTSPADMAKAMAAFRSKGGKVKKLAPGKAAGWHGKDDLGTDTHGIIGRGDTKKIGTRKKVKSMEDVDENYQVQKYTKGKKDGPPKSFGGNLKKATAHATKMGGDHRVHKEAYNNAKDPGEYDQEGDMAKTQLRTMIDAAKELHGMLGKDDNLPEWVQNKITKATDYIYSVRDYLKSER